MKAVSSNAVSPGQAAAPAAGAKSALWRGTGATGQECPRPHAACLTPRQLEVLALLCEGLPNKLIARRLDIATGTVKIHVSCILRELGVATRLQAVVAARRYGFPAEFAAEAPEQTAGPAAEDQSRTAARSSESHASRHVAVAA